MRADGCSFVANAAEFGGAVSLYAYCFCLVGASNCVGADDDAAAAAGDHDEHHQDGGGGGGDAAAENDDDVM